jgi:hypothetical protein
MATLADRNFNPGNLRDPATGNFRSFKSEQEGYAALMNDLQGKITGNIRTGLKPESTLHEFSKVYAPKSENDSNQYTVNLANALGVRPDTKLSELQNRVGEFAQAIARFEGYTGAKGFVAKPKAAAPAPVATPKTTSLLSENKIADIESGQKYGAFLPSSTTSPSKIGESAKMLSNIPSSAFNFAKGVVDFLNPVSTFGKVKEAVKTFQDTSKELGGAGAAAKAMITGLPEAAYKTVIPEAARGLIQAGGGALTGNEQNIDTGLQTAQRALVNDPVGQIAPFLLAAKGGASALDKAGVTKGASAAFDTGISKVAAPVTKSASYVFGKKIPSIEKATSAAGKILQGKTSEAEIGVKTLSKINTKGVKTYDDLSQALNQKITSNLAKVDEAFQTSPEIVPLKKLGQKTTADVGGLKTSVSINYVKTALDHLQELYKKTIEPVEELRIRSLTAKAKNQGLTPNEINFIAREYGTEFGAKAFNPKTGDPLTSVNAKAFENVRKGVKNTARSFLKDETAKGLDTETGNMITTKRLVDRMNEKINSLEQRVIKRGLIEKVARGLAKVVDVVTLGAPKAFITKLFFPSNVGLKTLNSLDLQAQLSKNLKVLQSLENAPDSIIVNTLKNLSDKAGMLDKKIPFLGIGKAQKLLQTGAFSPKQK